MKKFVLFLFMFILLFSNVYAYEEYHIGDRVTYNDEKYFVIENSNSEKKYVTLLKDLPLSMQEIDTYSSGNQNRFYAGHTMYLEARSPYVDDYTYRFRYDDSFIKPIVDYWLNNNIDANDLVEVNNYKARVLNNNDLSSLGYEYVPIYNGQLDIFGARVIGYKFESDNTVEWLNYNNEDMLTSVVFRWVNFENSELAVYLYSPSQDNFRATKGNVLGIIRPVINLKKDAIEGNPSYEFGSDIYYKGEKYNIIHSFDDYVVALKWEPLTQATINAAVSYTAGVTSFYTSDTCAYGDNNTSGCLNDYNHSHVKKIVDAWASDKFDSNDLYEVNGFKSRILTRDDLTNNLGYTMQSYGTEDWEIRLTSTSATPYFMDHYIDNASHYWFISQNEDLSLASVVLSYAEELEVYEYSQVRPVVNLSKCALGDEACENDDTMVCKEGTTPVTAKVKKINSFKQGDIVTIKGENYYVIKNSDKKSSYVVLMKAEPLTAEQINKYINNDYYVSIEGRVPYVLNQHCFFKYDEEADTYLYEESGCNFVDFDHSVVKQVIDGWANDTFEDNFLKLNNDYKVRLISLNDLINDLSYEIDMYDTSSYDVYRNSIVTPQVFSSYNNEDWTMSSYENRILIYSGYLVKSEEIEYYTAKYLRPVISVSKDKFEEGFTEEEVIIGCETDDGEIIPVEPPVDIDEDVVEVESTLSKTSLISMIISIFLIAIGLGIFLYNYRKHLNEINNRI